MRRTLLVLAAAALALSAAGCFPTAGPGWTYTPPTAAPAVTPVPSGAATAATAAPTAPSVANPTEVPGGSTGVVVSAINIAFEQTEIAAPADAKFTITFDNKDAGIPHNIAIKDSMNMEKFKGDLLTGPGQAQYTVDALPAGEYTFVCSVHPNMTGKLKVGP
jgi:plastocyanin